MAVGGTADGQQRLAPLALQVFRVQLLLSVNAMPTAGPAAWPFAPAHGVIQGLATRALAPDMAVEAATRPSKTSR